MVLCYSCSGNLMLAMKGVTSLAAHFSLHFLPHLRLDVATIQTLSWCRHGNCFLQATDPANREDECVLPGNGKDGFFLWLPAALSLPACALALSALARTSVLLVQTEEECCAAQPQPPVASGPCSGTCCHPVAVGGPAKEKKKVGWGMDPSEFNC